MTLKVLQTLAFLVLGLSSNTSGHHNSGTYGKFDVYDARMNKIEIRIILDNVVNALNEQKNLRAHLIAYAGKQACRNEAKSRLLEARRYLNEKRNIDSSRVTFIDGGFQTDWAVEIWIGLPENKPPEKEPTFKKSLVKIVKKCNLIEL